MKAERTTTSRVTSADVHNARSYFAARDIKRLGLSPLNEIGALSGIGPTPRRVGHRSYFHRDTYLAINHSRPQGLTLQRRTLLSRVSGAFVSMMASFGMLIGQTKNTVTTHPRRIAAIPLLAVSAGALLTFGILHLFFGSIDMATTPTTTSVARNETSSALTGSHSSTNSEPKERVTEDKDGAKNEPVTPTTSTATPDSSATPVTTNVPAYGVTNILPAGIPGVTTPVTTTVPGTSTNVDGKPAVITNPIGITLN